MATPAVVFAPPIFFAPGSPPSRPSPYDMFCANAERSGLSAANPDVHQYCERHDHPFGNASVADILAGSALAFLMAIVVVLIVGSAIMGDRQR